jgi:hypothetical protein
MVVGSFPSLGDADVCLSNLLEAEFAPSTISVITPDPKESRRLENFRGPLHGLPPNEALAQLRALGLADATIASYRQTLSNGGVLVAITVSDDLNPIAGEMLNDHDAGEVVSVPGNPAIGQGPKSQFQ